MKDNLESIKDIFSEFIILLIKFSKCRSEEIAMLALDHLKLMILKMIRDAGVILPESDITAISDTSRSEQDISGEGQNGVANNVNQNISESKLEYF